VAQFESLSLRHPSPLVKLTSVTPATHKVIILNALVAQTGHSPWFANAVVLVPVATVRATLRSCTCGFTQCGWVQAGFAEAGCVRFLGREQLSCLRFLAYAARE
jgi:hypothetical protein